MKSSDLTERERGHIEGYAAALQDILMKLTGDNGVNKSYDPCTISDHDYLHSYAFDLKEGVRHHKMENFENSKEIMDLMLGEVIVQLRDDYPCITVY